MVERHLALAHHVAERYLRSAGCRGGAAPEDVHAAACAALLPCLERFDSRQGTKLSSYAVPYLTGAIRHHLRDHWTPLKVPRRLLELQQRGVNVQKRRQSRGLAPLAPEQLARELGTSLEKLQEAERVWWGLQVDSLDERGDLQVGDPALDQRRDAQRDWLLEQLAQLPPRDQQLLRGIWIQPVPRRRLAAHLGLSGKALERRHRELLDQLLEKARASTAAIVV